MEAITAQVFGRYECELLTLGELEAFSDPLTKVLNVCSSEATEAAGPHTAVVVSYLRQLERAYPRLWTHKNGTPGALDGTMPGSAGSSPPSSPTRGLTRMDSLSSDNSATSNDAAVAELGGQWLQTYKHAKGAFADVLSGTSSDITSLHESLEWLVATALQIKSLLADENGLSY